MKTVSTRLVFQYWDHLRGDRAAPERGEIEPGAVRHALRDTFILENEATDRLVVRLAGTRVCALFGGELKNRPFLSIWGDAPTRVEVSRMADAVMDDCAGAVCGLHAETANGNSVELELVLLPLRHGGKTHARMMGAVSPVTSPPWLGFEKVERCDIRSMRIIWPSGLTRAAVAPEQRRAGFTLIPGGRR
jgi:hypothetical protein